MDMLNRFLKRRSEKKGLPPGSLVYLGEEISKKVKIRVLDYDEENFREKEIENVEECFAYKKEPTATWINVDGIHQREILESLGGHYDLHSLTLEDIMNTSQRPKAEDFDHYIYIVLRMIYLHPKESTLESEQISLILGENFVITFQEREGDVFDPVRQRIKEGKGRIRKMGADFLAYALIDAIVDNYFFIMEYFDERIESIEDNLLDDPPRELLSDIHNTKREVIYLRRAVWPLREVVSLLERGESHLFQKQTLMYLRDVYDHTIQVADTVDSFREMISGMHDLYLSNVSNKMNEVMKILTIIATIFIPLTFIAGIYGMNFKYMPELEWSWSYPLLWIIIIFIAILMLTFFRKKKWL